MEGMILGVDAEGGVIRTIDGARYRFPRSEWKTPEEPAVGDRVDFVPQEETALEVYLLRRRLPGVSDVMETIEKSEKTVPTIIYACYLGAVLWGVTALVGVVLAYVYRGNAPGKWYESHFDYQIRIFWRAFIAFLVGFLFIWALPIGLVIMAGTYVWLLVKIVKGWRCLSDGLPAPVS